jgi:thiol-disulfide isomerase/thioredoxin
MADPQPTDQPRRSGITKSWAFRAIAILLGAWLIIVLADVFGIGLALFLPWIQKMRSGPEVHVGIGKQLTFLELEPLTGSQPQVSLAELQGHVTLLNIWGTWCPPCRAELPHMAELRQRFAGQAAFRLVPISYPPGGQDGDKDSLHEETETLLKQLNLDLPTYYDPGGRTLAAVGPIIDFDGFPTSVLLDRRGVIRAIWVGYRPGVESEIEKEVLKVLNEPEEK